MTDRDGPRSNPYHPDPEKCCEACVFGAPGPHEAHCKVVRVFLEQLRVICDAFDAEYGKYPESDYEGRCMHVYATRFLSRHPLAGDISHVKHAS